MILLLKISFIGILASIVLFIIGLFRKKGKDTAIIIFGISIILLYISTTFTEPDIYLAKVKIKNKYSNVSNIKLNKLETIKKYSEYNMYIDLNKDTKNCRTVIHVKEKENEFDVWTTINDFKLVCKE